MPWVKKVKVFFKSDSLNLKWDPLSTWLNIFFNKKLIIFGIGLAENETFLRWLLLTKYKYIKYLDSRIKLGIYICCKPKEGNKQIIGKHFFLENVGFEIKYINDYKELYN